MAGKIDEYMKKVDNWEKDVKAVYKQILNSIPQGVKGRALSLKRIEDEIDKAVFDNPGDFEEAETRYNETLENLGKVYKLYSVLARSVREENKQPRGKNVENIIELNG
jgi:hypothetical protein